MQPRISMITLGVSDLKKSIEFYQIGLGFPKINSPPEVAFFDLNGTWLGLYNKQALAEDAQVEFSQAGFNNFALAHNVHSEKEVNSVVDRAVKVGAQLKKKPQKVFWGGYSGYFADPDGHLWEVAYNPFTWIGPKDN